MPDLSTLTEDTSPSSNDFVYVMNNAGTTDRKVQLTNLPGGGGGAGSGAMVAVATYNGTGQTSLDIPLTAGSDHYCLKGWIQPATDAQELRLRVTNDSFSTEESGTVYAFAEKRINSSSGAELIGNHNGQTYAEICSLAVGNDTNEEAFFELYIGHPEDAGLITNFQWFRTTVSPSATFQAAWGGAGYKTAEAIDGIRIYAASGNVDYAVTLYRFDVNGNGGLRSPTQSELTIATGAITPTGTGTFPVDTESDAASDDLDTITATNMTDGDIIILKAADSTRTVVVKNGTGNINCGSDFSLDNALDRITLQWDNGASAWVMLSSSSNGA